MFKLNTVSSEYACAANSNDKHKKIENIALWHRRLAHASIPKLNFLLKQKLDTKMNCVTCAKGKHAKTPFNHTGQRATELLDLIHSDVCGPMSVNSIGGLRNFC